jgi:hypothetical protein
VHFGFCMWIFSFVRVIALNLVNIFNFQLVLHIAPKVFDLESWNFTEMLVSMCRCAPGVFVDLYSNCKVIALDLVKICNFQLVLYIAQKVFDPESWNFAEMFQFCQSYCHWLNFWSAFVVVHLGVSCIFNQNL